MKGQDLAEITETNPAFFRSILISEARVLRDAVLRPNHPSGGSIYPGDESQAALHLGAFVGTKCVAVATVLPEAMPGSEDGGAWRLRGMATIAEFRGCGLGRRLACLCIEHAIEHRGLILWCTARVTTLPFYKSLGLEEFGQPFQLPQFSDNSYVLMRRLLG
jgi:GNAT superfamily N-acetyltransferase